MLKKLIIIFLFLTILIISGLVIKNSNKPQSTTSPEPEATPTIVLPTISEDIKVDLIPRSDKRSVTLKISGITDEIEMIEYELTYLTASKLARGVLGRIAVETNEISITRDDIVLGTCSSGSCVYDEGVTSIDLTLKFTTTSGPRIFQKTFPL
jgi:hypothetical protein